MITIEFESKEEAILLCNLVNLAIMAKGYEVAVSGAGFIKKIEKAVIESEKVKANAAVPEDAK